MPDQSRSDGRTITLKESVGESGLKGMYVLWGSVARCLLLIAVPLVIGAHYYKLRRHVWRIDRERCGTCGHRCSAFVCSASESAASIARREIRNVTADLARVAIGAVVVTVAVSLVSIVASLLLWKMQFAETESEAYAVDAHTVQSDDRWWEPYSVTAKRGWGWGEFEWESFRGASSPEWRAYSPEVFPDWSLRVAADSVGVAGVMRRAEQWDLTGVSWYFQIESRMEVREFGWPRALVGRVSDGAVRADLQVFREDDVQYQVTTIDARDLIGWYVDFPGICRVLLYVGLPVAGLLHYVRLRARRAAGINFGKEGIGVCPECGDRVPWSIASGAV